MKKLLVLYYSRSGNTEKMANAVAEGAKNPDVQVEVNYHIETPELLGYDAIIIGAPTYRKEIPVDFKNLFDEVAEKNLNLKGKIGATFGSYGWSGEAPQQVLDLMKKHEMQIVEPPVLAKYAPDLEALTNCKDLGKKVSETLMK